MAELINELIAPEVFTQLKEAEEGLDNLAKSVANLGKMGKVIEFNVKGATSLNEYTAAIEEMKKATAAMATVQGQYTESVNKATTAKERQLKAIEVAEGREMQAIQKVLEAQQKKAAKEEEILNRMIAAEEKASAKAIAAQERRYKKEEETLNRMIAAEQKAADIKQKIVDKSAKEAEKAAAAAEKAAQREEQALRQLNNEYETLKRSYTTAANAAKELGIALGTDSKEFKAAASAAKGMYDQLLKVERAVGQGQRAVGQYNQAAFAMQQILRETPAIATSFGTYISAISNNIAGLTDAIKNMRKTNEELVASGAKAIPIYKQIGAAIFSWETALILAITAAQIVVQKWDSISKVFSKTGNELKEIAAESKKTAAQETANAKALAAVAQDVSQSMNIRIEAVKKLQSAYPNYLGNLTQEAILTGKTADAMERLNEALINKSIMEAYSEKVGEQAKKFAELQDSLEKYEGKVQEADSRFSQLNNGSTNQYAINSRTRAAQDKANAEREVETIKKKIAETEKEMDRYQKQAEKFGKLAAGVLVGKEDPKKSPKGRTAKDTTLKSESELLKAEYELSKQRVEQDAQIQKEIADNEKNTINQRLDAYMEYTADVLQLLRMAKDYEIKQEDLKIQDIKRKKKDAKAVELIALQDQEDAANVIKKGIEEKFQNDLSDVERKGNKDRLAILNTGNEQWIKSEEFRNAKLKEQQVTWYLTQEALLKKALDAKEITTKEYNTRLRNLQKQEGQMLLDDDIDLYTRLLQNKTLSAEKQLEIQNKLNAALKQKSQGGAEPTQRRSGRLTDSLGKSLGIVEEDALQEFYDRTVQLANQAADAIIAAKERQFQAEQDMLDKQKEGIQANYEMQLDYINATTRNETERANKIAQLQAQKSAQEATIEQKKREVAKRQATFEKTAAIASIIQNTAVAIAGALKYGVAAPPIIALIAAAGAVQLAAAANAPIPAYKEGTNYHQGGMFIAGDGGQKELIIAPNKKPYFSASTSTLYNEAAGTKVIPGDIVKQMENNITSTASYGGSVMPSIEYDRLATLISDKIGSHLWQHGENLSHTIMAARTKMPKQDMREAVLQLQRLGK
jgi:hypothetical protein